MASLGLQDKLQLKSNLLRVFFLLPLPALFLLFFPLLARAPLSFSRPLYFSTRSSTPYSRDCAGAPENLILTRFFLLHFPDDFHFTRKKKHPEIAHRSHEFFDPSLAPAFPTRASHNQYDSSRERVRNPFYCRASK